MEEIGYDDYFFGKGICLIEWADLIQEILPEKRIGITIEKDLEKGFDYRRITIEGAKKEQMDILNVLPADKRQEEGML